MIRALLEFLYAIFGLSKRKENEIKRKNTISSAGEYLEVKDNLKKTEETIKDTVSEPLKKEEQKISF